MGGDLTGFIPIILIFGIMYFLILRPQVKKQKELDKMRTNIKSGDQIVTNGGIHGKVSAVDEETKTVKVKIDSGTSIKLDKSAISNVIVEKK
jgi:preprotein translocase subunit YajC